MPDGLTIDPVPRRDPIQWREWASLLVAVLLGLGIWHVDAVAGQAEQASKVNRQIGYLDRAAVCDFIREFGGVEPVACADPQLLAYRDRRIVPGEGERRNTTDLLCRVLTVVTRTANRPAQCKGTR